MKRIIVVLAMVLASLLPCQTVGAIKNVSESDACKDANISDEARDGAGCNETRDGLDVATALIDVAIGIVGLISVIVIVFAGQRYITAAGNPSRIKEAKDMILYGVIGVVVAILAWAIVTFIIDTGVFK